MGATRRMPEQAEKELSASYEVPGLGQIIKLEDPDVPATDAAPLKATYYIREEGATGFSPMDVKCGSSIRSGTTTSLGYKGTTIEIQDKIGEPLAGVSINGRDPIDSQKSLRGEAAFDSVKKELSQAGILPKAEGIHLLDQEDVVGANKSARVSQTDFSGFCLK